jgi:hypothetical protein
MDDRKTLKTPLDTKEIRELLLKQIDNFLENGQRPHIEPFDFTVETFLDKGLFKDELTISVTRFRFKEDD